MPPKLVSDDGQHVVIRPLAYVNEADLTRFAAIKQFPIIPCNLCGSQDNLKRQEVKRMLAEWERRYPGRVKNTFNALSRVVPFAPDGSQPARLRRTAADRSPVAGRRHRVRRRTVHVRADEPTAGVIRFAEAE